MGNRDLINRLLPYTGYNLKAAFKDNIVNVDPASLARMCTPNDTGRYFKPILFSSDDLTEEIETEYGKEVPLIELAKINYERFEISPIGIPEFKVDLLRDNTVVGSWEDVGGEVVLVYDPDDWTFKAEFAGHSEQINIIKMIDYICSRHIAIGLESHEYVNAFLLKTNPYAGLTID